MLEYGELERIPTCAGESRRLTPEQPRYIKANHSQGLSRDDARRWLIRVACAFVASADHQIQLGYLGMGPRLRTCPVPATSVTAPRKGRPG